MIIMIGFLVCFLTSFYTPHVEVLYIIPNNCIYYVYNLFFNNKQIYINRKKEVSI